MLSYYQDKQAKTKLHCGCGGMTVKRDDEREGGRNGARGGGTADKME